MKPTKTLPLTALAAALLTLAACGGGGGTPSTGGTGTGGTGTGGTGTYTVSCADGSTTSSNTSVSDTSNCRTALPASLQTTVPTPTYAATSQELIAFNEINRIRGACGFGLLKQDTRLDAAAAGHTNYIVTNVAVGRSDAVGHAQRTDYLNFTGVRSWDRAFAAGYGQNAAEILSSSAYGADGAMFAVKGLKRAVYHIYGILHEGNDVGLSHSGAYLVANPGYLNATDRNLLPSNQVNAYPCGSSTIDNLSHTDNEVPNPMAGSGRTLGSYGHPLVIMSRADTKLYIDSWVLNYANGAATVSAPAAANGVRTVDNDTSGVVRDNFGFFIPDARLMGNKTYTSTVTGRIRETGATGVYIFRPFTKTWSFTTPCPTSYLGVCYD